MLLRNILSSGTWVLKDFSEKKKKNMTLFNNGYQNLTSTLPYDNSEYRDYYLTRRMSELAKD